jgi:hypothetical protein
MTLSYNGKVLTIKYLLNSFIQDDLNSSKSTTTINSLSRKDLSSNFDHQRLKQSPILSKHKTSGFDASILKGKFKAIEIIHEEVDRTSRAMKKRNTLSERKNEHFKTILKRDMSKEYQREIDIVVANINKQDINDKATQMRIENGHEYLVGLVKGFKKQMNSIGLFKLLCVYDKNADEDEDECQESGIYVSKRDELHLTEASLKSMVDNSLSIIRLRQCREDSLKSTIGLMSIISSTVLVDTSSECLSDCTQEWEL